MKQLSILIVFLFSACAMEVQPNALTVVYVGLSGNASSRGNPFTTTEAMVYGKRLEVSDTDSQRLYQIMEGKESRKATAKEIRWIQESAYVAVFASTESEQRLTGARAYNSEAGYLVSAARTHGALYLSDGCKMLDLRRKSITDLTADVLDNLGLANEKIDSEYCRAREAQF
jgi:hypothetical protein